MRALRALSILAQTCLLDGGEPREAACRGTEDRGGEDGSSSAGRRHVGCGSSERGQDVQVVVGVEE